MPSWKRVCDLACCIVALPVLAAAAAAAFVVMRLTSPGPVFFRQERVGYRGKRFHCYKFRTMRVGADTSVHQAHCDHLIRSNAPMMKMDARGDARLVPGGWLVRAAGLDELPQLINVFRGEMSLIGPRPCVPYEYDRYLPWQRERFDAMPGLTGLWQVSGKNRTTFEEMTRLDIHYARNVSWWLDLKIVLLTVPALVLQIADTRRGRKAAPQFPKTVPRSPKRATGIPAVSVSR